MRPQVLLVTLAVLAILAALPLISNAAGSVEEEGGAAAAVAGDDDAGVNARWPCCNQCGVCNRKFPPECKCRDISFRGCNPACKKCVKFTAPDQPPLYKCADMLTNFCKRRCTPTSLVLDMLTAAAI